MRVLCITLQKGQLRKPVDLSNSRTLILSCFIDGVFGDPVYLYHPVQLIGNVETVLENYLYKHTDSRYQQQRKGLLLLMLLGSSTCASMRFLSHVPIVRLYLMQASLAQRALMQAGSEIHTSLEQAILTNNLDIARSTLSQYVGRNTSELNEVQIAKAGIETLAENTVDGFVTPFFWMCVGSLVRRPLEFVWVYKTVSTLDSMVAYKNERYNFFGRASAYADDIMAYIPARIAGLSSVLAAFILNLDAKKSCRALFLESTLHESPNAGVCEASFAGALDVELGGKATYDGTIVNHPVIHAGGGQAQPSDIQKARRLSATTACISALGIVVISAWLKNRNK